jgi:hypothetical protein
MTYDLKISLFFGRVEDPEIGRKKVMTKSGAVTQGPLTFYSRSVDWSDFSMAGQTVLSVLGALT